MTKDIETIRAALEAIAKRPNLPNPDRDADWKGCMKNSSYEAREALEALTRLESSLADEGRAATRYVYEIKPGVFVNGNKEAIDALAGRLAAAPASPAVEALRVLAYDSADFVSDTETPKGLLYRPATVKAWRFDRYGRLLADVVFDHGGESNGHLAEGLEPIPVSKGEG